MRHCRCRANLEVMEEAFMPTLTTLFDAPDASPLVEVDANNVAELLVQLTNCRHLLTVNNNNKDMQQQQVWVVPYVVSVSLSASEA